MDITRGGSFATGRYLGGCVSTVLDGAAATPDDLRDRADALEAKQEAEAEAKRQRIADAALARDTYRQICRRGSDDGARILAADRLLGHYSN